MTDYKDWHTFCCYNCGSKITFSFEGNWMISCDDAHLKCSVCGQQHYVNHECGEEGCYESIDWI